MLKVDENIYRGPRPQSLADIPGIKTLLDLESGVYDFFHSAAVKAYKEIEKTVKEVDVPLGDILPPIYWKLNRCLWFMMSKDLWPIYVHCRYGVDRTGIVCAYYRVKANGWTPDKAIQEMYDLGFHKCPYWWWVPFLRRTMK